MMDLIDFFPTKLIQRSGPNRTSPLGDDLWQLLLAVSLETATQPGPSLKVPTLWCHLPREVSAQGYRPSGEKLSNRVTMTNLNPHFFEM